VHSINGSCDCSDVHYNKPPQGLCKHRLSVYLARRVYQLMAAPTPEEGSLKDTTPLPEVPRNSDTPALPEAPASVNCHLTIAGRQVQLTLRDTDEARLLARLASVLEQYPMPQPAPQASSQGQEWCAVHHVVMKDNNKDGRRWFSHRLENGTWCKGR
jgi:hypothetical protein